MTVIRTYSGQQVDIEKPAEESILPEDIAHALSFLCRGSGQTRVFFSVAAHCVLCAREALARGYGREIALMCLLHDASEAYMADLPRPIKVNLVPVYGMYEEKLLACIYRKFLGRSPKAEELQIVRAIDDALLPYDLHYLLGMEAELPPVHVTIDYTPVPFERTEREYLDLARELLGRTE